MCNKTYITSKLKINSISATATGKNGVYFLLYMCVRAGQLGDMIENLLAELY